MIFLEKGALFYYADRKKKEPVKCYAIGYKLGYPRTVFARRMDTNECFECYEGFGTYPLSKYEEALEDAKIEGERIIK